MTPIPVEQMLRQAIEAHLDGRADEAAAAYRRILEQDPLQAGAQHYLGVYLHQAGRHDEAVERLTLASRLAPGHSPWHNERGNVLFALGRSAEAEAAYLLALGVADHPVQDVLIRTNLGTAQRASGRSDEALKTLLDAVAIAPDHVPALLQISELYEAAGDRLQASHFRCRAFVLPPLEGKSHEMLGKAYYFLGRYSEAADAYRAWLVNEPGQPQALHMLAACSRQDTPARASDAYVEQHFDRFAETFDANLLGSLDYRGPQLIGSGMALLAKPERQFDILDLGCGTGLCAPVLAPYSRTLVGVDLAGRMLEKAATRGGYDRLEKSGIDDYLASHPRSCDLVTAADTLIYFGDLTLLMRGMSGALRSGGYLVFTIELAMPEDPAPEGICLHASGRYRHRLDHVEQKLGESGLRVLHLQAHTLREEVGRPVEGLLVVAQR